VDTWKIVALDTGTSILEKSILTYLTDVGTSIRIPRVMWYIEGQGHRIMVDTSVESETIARDVIGENLTRGPEQEPRAALALIGVDPASIDLVVFTHLHWDHCGNNNLFPQARFLAQRREISYAAAPGTFFQRAFLSPALGLMPPYAGIRLESVDGDQELWPGLELLHCPGHTPGSQAVRVKTTQGWHTISGDAIFTYENLNRDIPPGFHINVDQSMESMHRIARVSDVVLPSHEYGVFAGQPVAEFGT
jgi:glyoxylase-like metal-dependent hydrolase (beta-lactamase superfamily II)